MEAIVYLQIPKKGYKKRGKFDKQKGNKKYGVEM